MTSSQSESRFIFVVCQQGAEQAVKHELSRNHPELNFAFSRPGFLTFKLIQTENNNAWPESFLLKSTFARTYGWSLGRASGNDANQLADQLLTEPQFAQWFSLQRDRGKLRHLHVWQRDSAIPGYRGFEPGISPLAESVGEVILQRLNDNTAPTAESTVARRKLRLNQQVDKSEYVIDVVLVEPNQWWLGYHVASTTAGRWPGGVPLLSNEVEPINRAWMKAAEATAWAGMKIKAGETCAEIGSAPGGCAQFLLSTGAKVIGIDPAEMDETIIAHENFTHIRKRGHQVQKKLLAAVKWLFADLNQVPNYTLDTIEAIVTNQHVHVKGIVLTLKVADWSQIDAIPGFRQRVKGWGFKIVKTRQLAFNRQEFCLVGVRDRVYLRKPGRQQKLTTAPPVESQSPEPSPQPTNLNSPTPGVSEP